MPQASAYQGETGGFYVRATKKTIVDSLSVEPQTLVLQKGVTYELPSTIGDSSSTTNGTYTMAPITVSSSPAEPTDMRVFWYEFDQNGVIEVTEGFYEVEKDVYKKYTTIEAQKTGAATLYVSDWYEYGLKATVNIVVVEPGESVVYAQSIAVSPSNLVMNVDEYTMLEATVTPSNATAQTVNWSSDNNNIATVNSYGRVTAKNPGTTTIRATAMDGSGKIAACSITVYDPSVSGTPIVVKCSGGLSVMSAASGGTTLGTFDNGSTVFLMDETPQNETMFKVYGTMSNGKTTEGWCSGEYLAKEVEYVYLKSTDNWKIRSGAGTGYSQLGLIESGNFAKLLIKAYATANGYTWHKILYNNIVGYVADTIDSEGNSANYLFIMHWETLVNAQPPIVPTAATNDCLLFIIDYEGKEFFATVQDDGYGNPTIGYGHLVKADENLTTITKEEALALFSQDISSVQTTVSTYAKNRSVIWNQQQFDAFVSLNYNAGSDTGSVMDDIIAGTDPYVAFAKVSNANGGFSLGLYRRRMDEADIFVLGDYTREYRSAPVG